MHKNLWQKCVRSTSNLDDYNIIIMCIIASIIINLQIVDTPRNIFFHKALYSKIS